MFATSSTHVVCPVAENGIEVVSEGNLYAGLGQEVGQSVSATINVFPQVDAMFVRLDLRLASVAAEL